MKFLMLNNIFDFVFITSFDDETLETKHYKNLKYVGDLSNFDYIISHFDCNIQINFYNLNIFLKSDDLKFISESQMRILNSFKNFQCYNLKLYKFFYHNAILANFLLLSKFIENQEIISKTNFIIYNNIYNNVSYITNYVNNIK